nr:MAG TPA: hypothetical protein [Inoviridae sp.]
MLSTSKNFKQILNFFTFVNAFTHARVSVPP